jgi:hypothetical protein
MKRFRRWVFNGIAAISLLLCITAIGLWVRSYWIVDQIRNVGVYVEQDFGSDSGRLLYNIQDVAHPSPRSNGRWFHHVYFHDSSDRAWHIWSDEVAEASWSLTRTGFVVAVRSALKSKRIEYISIVIPDFALVLVTGIMPAIVMIRRWKRRARSGSGQCSKCGYDLRATPERCPECGTVPAIRETVKEPTIKNSD